MFSLRAEPLSTKDVWCAALAESGVNVFAWHGAKEEEYKDQQKRRFPAGRTSL
jgi:S-adenosylhomocysteine hydrolase